MDTIKKEGILNLYSGLGAGLSRQIVYATSRLGLYEAFRDEVAKYRQIDFVSRLFLGCISGGLAAAVSCPAEVTLVRMSNDTTIPAAQRYMTHIITHKFLLSFIVIITES
jgi:solute carrier family 25 oxoglutarate transporter 11